MNIDINKAIRNILALGIGVVVGVGAGSSLGAMIGGPWITGILAGLATSHYILSTLRETSLFQDKKDIDVDEVKANFEKVKKGTSNSVKKIDNIIRTTYRLIRKAFDKARK